MTDIYLNITNSFSSEFLKKKWTKNDIKSSSNGTIVFNDGRVGKSHPSSANLSKLHHFTGESRYIDGIGEIFLTTEELSYKKSR